MTPERPTGDGAGPQDAERLKFIRDSLPFWKSIVSIDEAGIKRIVKETEWLLSLLSAEAPQGSASAPSAQQEMTRMATEASKQRLRAEQAEAKFAAAQEEIASADRALQRLGYGGPSRQTIAELIDRIAAERQEQTRKAVEFWDRAERAEQSLREHRDAVGRFLSELHAIMVDPLAEGTISIEDLMPMLKAAAIRDRDAEQSLREKDAEIERWRADFRTVNAALAEAQERERTLREALETYGAHHADCAVERWFDSGGVMRRPRPDCTCGLSGILSVE